MSVARERCRAKLNLHLDVVARRPDGYHDIETVFHEIDLADELEARELPGAAGNVSIEVACEGAADARHVPADASNLAVRAARALLGAAGAAKTGVALRLVKRIPAGGGLGGGSADAAGALRAVNRLLGLAASDVDLERIALSIGSDVPFLVRGGTAIGRGRGERLERVDVRKRIDFAVIVPDFGVSTAAVYAALSRGLPARRDPAPVLAALAAGDAAALAASCSNALEAPARRVEPRLAPLIDALRYALGTGVHLSGSGSSLFIPLAADEATPDLTGMPHVAAVLRSA